MSIAACVAFEADPAGYASLALLPGLTRAYLLFLMELATRRVRRRPGRTPLRNVGYARCGECLDRVLIYNTRHLLAALREYLAHYNGITRISARATPT